MLVGFGAYGLDPQTPQHNEAQELQRQVLRDGISALGPQMDSMGLDYQQSASSDGTVYLLTTQGFYDKRKYMHLGIGAAAGLLLGAVGVYVLTR